MKVVQFFGQSSYGGVTTHMLDLSVGLAELGHSVAVLAEPDSYTWEHAAAAGLQTVSSGPLNRGIAPMHDAHTVGVLRRVSGDADIVHLHSFKAGLLGRLANLPAKVVYTPHCPPYLAGFAPWKRAVSRGIEVAMSARSEAAIAVGIWEQQQLRLPNIECIRNAARSEHPPQPRQLDRSRVFVVGRFSPPKRQDLVVEALKQIPEDQRPVVEFFGDGPQLDAVERQAEKLGVDGATIFHGFDAHPWARRPLPGVLVLMSDWEATPYAILEALARGIPVIASAVGEIPFLAAETDSVIACPNDADALAQRLDAVVGLDSAAHRRFADAARLFHEGTGSFEHMTERTVELYHRVLGTPPTVSGAAFPLHPPPVKDAASRWRSCRDRAAQTTSRSAAS